MCVKTPMGLTRFEIDKFELRKKHRYLPRNVSNQIYFYTIEDLLIGFKCAEGILASKYGYGYTAI